MVSRREAFLASIKIMAICGVKITLNFIALPIAQIVSSAIELSEAVLQVWSTWELVKRKHLSDSNEREPQFYK